MSQAAGTIIGPADHGRRMGLDEFDAAGGREGRLYELSRGVILVTDVPNPPHGDVVFLIREALAAYHRAHPGVIHRVYGGAECKLLIEGTESERHPGLAVYKTPAPGSDSSIWSTWVPEVVIEVVSDDSVRRDYEEKPEDYLQFGVLEYWIVDPLKKAITINRRVRGRWKPQVLLAGQNYTTPLLPGFELHAANVIVP